MQTFKKTEKQKEATRLMSKQTTTLLEGGGRCFVRNQKVITNIGPKEIGQIKPGDIVLSINEKTGEDQYKPVDKVYSFFENRKRLIRLTLASGESIEGTEDHEIFFEGGWHTLSYVIEYIHGNMETNTRV